MTENELLEGELLDEELLEEELLEGVKVARNHIRHKVG